MFALRTLLQLGGDATAMAMSQSCLLPQTWIVQEITMADVVAYGNP